MNIQYLGYKSIKIGSYTTSSIELIDLLKAWVVISISFGIMQSKGIGASILSSKFVILMIFSAITVGLAFLLHELAHKIVAQRYGCQAEFRADNKMLLIAVLMALFLPIILFAPGAVMIGGPVGKRRNGIISAAGPATNYALAAIFLFIMFNTNIGWLKLLCFLGFEINTWIGLFNMIPFSVFDGKKIWDWNKFAYISMVIIGVALMLSADLIRGIAS